LISFAIGCGYISQQTPVGIGGKALVGQKGHPITEGGNIIALKTAKPATGRSASAGGVHLGCFFRWQYRNSHRARLVTGRRGRSGDGLLPATANRSAGDRRLGRVNAVQ